MMIGRNKDRFFPEFSSFCALLAHFPPLGGCGVCLVDRSPFGVVCTRSFSHPRLYPPYHILLPTTQAIGPRLLTCGHGFGSTYDPLSSHSCPQRTADICVAFLSSSYSLFLRCSPLPTRAILTALDFSSSRAPQPATKNPFASSLFACYKRRLEIVVRPRCLRPRRYFKFSLPAGLHHPSSQLRRGAAARADFGTGLIDCCRSPFLPLPSTLFLLPSSLDLLFVDSTGLQCG